MLSLELTRLRNAAGNGAERIILLSGNTYVIVLALYYFETLKSRWLLEMWLRVRIDDTTRYIPLHKIAICNPRMRAVLTAVHMLTGCDMQ